MEEIAQVCQELFTTALASLEEGALPIVLGGDHSLGAGSVAASAAWLKGRGQALGLIWVDAHADINSPATSPSGNVHGMPLAALLGREPAELARISGAGPAILPEHTVLVGIRNLDDREKEIVKASGVHAFTMKDIDRLGIAEVMDRALAAASAGTGGVHVSFDLDVCDPAIAPGVGTPVKGGLDYREAHFVMEAVAESGLLVALDRRGSESRPRPPERHRGTGHRAGAVGLRQAHPVRPCRPGGNQQAAAIVQRLFAPALTRRIASVVPQGVVQ